MAILICKIGCVCMIGERLQELRKDRKMSQSEFAELFGVFHYTVSSYECNRSDPDDKTKVIIAKLFDVSIDYLLGLIDEPVSYDRKQITVNIPREFDKKDVARLQEYIQFLKFRKFI